VWIERGNLFFFFFCVVWGKKVRRNVKKTEKGQDVKKVQKYEKREKGQAHTTRGVKRRKIIIIVRKSLRA